MWWQVLLAVPAFQHGGYHALRILFCNDLQQVGSCQCIAAGTVVVAMIDVQPLCELAQAVAVQARQHFACQPHGT